VNAARTFTPRRLLTAGLILLVAVALVLLFKKSDRLLEVPDEAHALSGVVSIPGTKVQSDPGGIYYVDVLVQRASLLQATFPFTRPEGADLIPEEAFVPSGLTYQQQIKLEAENMKVSQEKAAVVALRALGYKVPAREAGVRIIDVEQDSHAHGVLRAQDVVVATDGRPVRNRADLFDVMSKHRVGDNVRVTVLRARKRLTFKIRTIADSNDAKRPIIGFIPFETLKAQLPFDVNFDLNRDVGGPSAGLAFALEVMEARGRDVDHGLKIAATGVIGLDGKVGSIGGIKQKTIGARQAHVDAFLVPVDGDNAKEAKRYAHGLRIIPVKTFQQALRALATLAGKA
jgi:PDZ domain-containing protein